MKSLLCAKSEMLRLNLKSWSMQFARIPQPRWAREWSGKWRRKSGRWPTSRVKNNSFPPPSPHTWVKLACGSKNKLAKLRRCDNSRVSFGSQVWPSELLPYQVVLILRFSQYQYPAQMVLKAGSLYPFHVKDIVSHFWPCFCVDDDVCRE